MLDDKRLQEIKDAINKLKIMGYVLHPREEDFILETPDPELIEYVMNNFLTWIDELIAAYEASQEQLAEEQKNGDSLVIQRNMHADAATNRRKQLAEEQAEVKRLDVDCHRAQATIYDLEVLLGLTGLPMFEKEIVE